MISRSDMISLICRFREICLEQYPQDIDPLTTEERLARIGLEPKDPLLAKLHVGNAPGPIEDICRLVNNPRLLKAIFRTSYQTWNALHGELDFDDIFVLNVLRFAAPEVFEFLLGHAQEIRALELKGQFSKRDERLNDVNLKWERYTKNAAWDTSSAKSLTQFLFPCWREQDYSWGKESLQGVQETKYWARFLTGEIEKKDFRDQEVLNGLKNYKEIPLEKHFRGMSIVEALNSGKDFTERFEHFAKVILDGNDVRKIASNFFETVLKTCGNKADTDLGGFIPLWRVSIRNPIDKSEHLKWVQEEAEKAIPISLELSNGIYYYWRSNDEADIQLKQAHPDLRAAIVARAKEVYAGNPKAFISAINPKRIYSSYHLSVFYSNEKDRGAGFVPADWEWFAELLINSANMDRQIVLPQIAVFVVKEDLVHSGVSCRFDQTLCNGLFEKNKRGLMLILSQEISTADFTAREANIIKCARDYAGKWLESNLENQL